DAAVELDHLAGAYVVEARHARDAVAHRDHLPDLGDLGRHVEVRDGLLEDGGDFGGADIHHADPFMARRRRSSLVAREASTRREPSLTWSPPRMRGSTLMLSRTLRPAVPVNVRSIVWRWLSLSGRAETTSAVSSPRRRASSLMNASMIWPSMARRPKR